MLSHKAAVLVRDAASKSFLNKFSIRSYLVFCNHYKLDAAESSRSILFEQLRQYAMFRIEFIGASGESVYRDISDIETYLASEGIHCDVKKWKPMSELLKQLKKKYPTKTQTKRAYRSSELVMIFDTIKPRSIDSLVIRSILAFAVCGALRGSEYTAPKKKPSQAQTYNMVRGSRISYFTDNTGAPAMVYFFFKSKTNGTLKREFVVMPCCCRDLLPCALHELERLKKKIKNLTPNTFLFVWADGSFVTYRDMLRLCKGASNLIGASSFDIGTHSARKARIVEAAKRGVPSHILLLMGRWSGMESIKPYLNMDPQSLATAISAPAPSSIHQFNGVFAQHTHHT